jgi:hypothetical protein
MRQAAPSFSARAIESAMNWAATGVTAPSSSAT